MRRKELATRTVRIGSRWAQVYPRQNADIDFVNCGSRVFG
jgi:hypothetical protein